MGLLGDVLSADGGTELFVLGPPASGRRLLLVGLFEAARDDDRDVVREANDDLRQLAMSFTSGARDAGWPDEATRERARDLRLGLTGGLFSQGPTVATTDHGRAELEALKDVLPAAADTVDEADLRELKQRVEAADALVYVVDCERTVEEGTPDTASYTEIIRAAPNKRALVVATKADVLAERFYEETGQEPKAHFEKFRAFVDEQLRRSSTAKALLQTTDRIAHPVYYRTETTDGEREPMRTRDGRVQSVGFDRLIHTLR